MIPRVLEHIESERCSSPDWVNCQFADEHFDPKEASVCPFLHEALVQYCTASPATRFVPYSESLLSKCGTEAYRYCELYLAMEHSGETESHPAETRNHADYTSVDGIAVSPALYYSTNHMWLDRGSSGCCHIGVDAFLAKVIGCVDNIDFVEGRDAETPTIILRVNGVDLHMVFPNRLQIAARNNYLRSFPQKLISDPYTTGWLYQGHEPRQLLAPEPNTVCLGLMDGKKVVEWMHEEVHRLSAYVHERVGRLQFAGESLVADGGTFCAGLMQNLDRQEILKLFNDFFSPNACRRRIE
jgi:glycine cleavage system H lipoate-binding protein